MTIITHQGDAVKWARKRARATGPAFHALFCDAPYEMDFMGKEWDGSGVAFDPDTWEAFARLLFPGAFLFVFAGTINDDLISVAMRKAGLRKFHKVMGWAYGSGFPKASRVDANIEKRRNDDIRHVCKYLRSQMERAGKSSREIAKVFDIHSRMVDHWAARDTDSQPKIPTWDQWEKLKEILSFNGDMDSEVKRLNDRKGTYGEDWHKREIVGRAVGAQAESTGKYGGWGKDNGSGRSEFDITAPATPLAQAFSGHRYGLQALKPAIETILVFQKPYNGKPIDNITETGAGALNIEGGRIGTDTPRPLRLLDNVPGFADIGKAHGSPAIGETLSGRWPSNLLLLDEGAARALDEQSGDIKTKRQEESVMCDEESNTWGGTFQRNRGARGYSDSGGASRFFFQVSEQIDEADPVFYSAKASRKERDAGLDSRNPHPTVKPLSLCKYLATLLLPPIEYAPRRLFVPFAGSGSEQIGAHLAGWEEIEGVELTKEYIPINEARVKYWQGRSLPSKNGSQKTEEKPLPGQLELI